MENICCVKRLKRKRFFAWSDITFILDWETSFKVTAHLSFEQRNSVGEVWGRLNQGKRQCDPKRIFCVNSALTFFFHPETWFKVTAHLLPKALCGWIMSQIRPREERYSPDKDLRWTDWSLLVAHRTGPYNNLTVIKNLIYQISHVPWMNPQIVKCDNDEFLVILKQNFLL